jgi:tetratricopeptide (TPR) repeat protein
MAMDSAAIHRRRPFGRLPLATGILGLALVCACFGTSEQQRKQAEIQYDLGVTELADGRVREALNYFMQSIEEYPEFARAHNGLGLALYLLGKHDEALEHFQRALELDPEYNEVRNNIARLHISQGRYRKAIPMLEEALEDVFLRERYLAESNLGWALFQTGREEAGIERVMNALAQNEKLCVGYEYLGLMYKKQKRYSEAVEEFETLLEKCPEYVRGHLELAKLQLMSGSVETGCQHLRTCHQLGRRSRLGRECKRLLRSSCNPDPDGSS